MPSRSMREETLSVIEEAAAAAESGINCARE